MCDCFYGCYLRYRASWKELEITRFSVYYFLFTLKNYVNSSASAVTAVVVAAAAPTVIRSRGSAIFAIYFCLYVLSIFFSFLILLNICFVRRERLHFGLTFFLLCLNGLNASILREKERDRKNVCFETVYSCVSVLFFF